MDSLSTARTLRTAVRDGDPVVGGWVSIGHPAVAEILAGEGLDFVTLDTEHAPIGLERLADLARAVDAAPGDAVPFARVPAGDPVRIKRVLDTGVGGLLVPRVESAAAAETAVDASRYPPAGIRGVAGARASGYGRDLGTALDAADDAITRIVQIETEAALDRVEAIGRVDGVDALFVGPADLSAALGVPLDYDAPAFRDALAAVVDGAAAAGTPLGIFATDPEHLRTWLDAGVDFAIVGYDAAVLRSGTAALQAAFAEAVEE